MISGLDDIVAAETRISDVDGVSGRLIIRGVSLDQLVTSNRFEDVAALLLQGLFDDPLSASTVKAQLGAARAELFGHVGAMDQAILALPPFDATRALIARLGDGDDLSTAIHLMAAPAVFLPAVLRIQAGKPPVPSRASLSHAADTLQMLNGTRPTAEEVAGLDAYLVTICDHGLNASTFAARVVASTHAGLTSSVLAALGALKGPLHGGAPGPVLDMLDAIGSPEKAGPWLANELDRGERLMGFGHRIYRVRDPRADALKMALRAVVDSRCAQTTRVTLAEAVERAALGLLKARKPDRALETNVEFYTALLLDALGFPRDAFTGVFSIGRMAGWIAHAREQALEGRLIRPQSRYVGAMPAVA
jgi:citrate synthase